MKKALFDKAKTAAPAAKIAEKKEPDAKVLVVAVAEAATKATNKRPLDKVDAPEVKRGKEAVSHDDKEKPAPPPRLDILRFVLGAKFVVNVAQSLINKGAKQAVGSLAQKSFLANLANSIITLARPDLADEASYVTSKSSSVADKETVHAIRQVVDLPKSFAAALRSHRLQQLKQCGTRQLVGFAALAACDALLNACLVVSAERTNVVVASALSSFKKAEFKRAATFLSSLKVLPANLLDLDLTETWRITGNRYTLLVCRSNDLLLVDSAAFNNPTHAREPAPKRVHIDESKNETSSSTYSLPLTLLGSYGNAMASSENVFRYNVEKLLKGLSSGAVLLPNKTMMSLFSMLYQTYNSHEAVNVYLNLSFNTLDRTSNMRADPNPRPFRAVNPIAQILASACDTSVADHTHAFYKANPSLARSHHEWIVQSNRALMNQYIAEANAPVPDPKTDEKVKSMLQWDLPSAHLLFGFIRMDQRLAKQRVGEPAVHPAARVVSSNRDRTGVPLTLSVNELPLGVSVRMPAPVKSILLTMWKRFIKHIGVADANGVLLNGADERFEECYNKANYGSFQWLAGYFDKSNVPSDEHKLLFREAMMPIMFALFPPSFMGAPPDNK